ncbi:MAG: hypothetical protein EOO28_12095 [Comamonadaceae bacterium]|nr:MAG: hypothetical protein EOO28_12095 [Comamonadaceae bacterium]
MSTAIISGTGGPAFTLVAGTFRNPVMAADAARRLQDRMPTAEVRLVQPDTSSGGDDGGASESVDGADDRGMFEMLGQSRVALCIAGAVSGLLVAGSMLASGWPTATASPVFILLTAAVGGAVTGLLFAGLLTLRPDRSYVIRQVRSRTRHGEWAVVAQPGDEEQADSARSLLREAGGAVVRSA